MRRSALAARWCAVPWESHCCEDSLAVPWGVNRYLNLAYLVVEQSNNNQPGSLLLRHKNIENEEMDEKSAEAVSHLVGQSIVFGESTSGPR